MVGCVDVVVSSLEGPHGEMVGMVGLGCGEPDGGDVSLGSAAGSVPPEGARSEAIVSTRARRTSLPRHTGPLLRGQRRVDVVLDGGNASYRRTQHIQCPSPSSSVSVSLPRAPCPRTCRGERPARPSQRTINLALGRQAPSFLGNVGSGT